MTNPATKTPVAFITITRAEGPSALCVTRDFSSFEAASAALRRDMHTYSAMGYDKHDLAVRFVDGEIYRGRLDCKRDGSDYDVARHVRETLEFYAGARKPAHMTDAQYSAYLRREPADVAEALAYLATYEIP